MIPVAEAAAARKDRGKQMSFENRTVWITGASSGIGEALVHAFARRNANVVLSARRADELERVRREASLTDDRSAVVPLDLADPTAFPAAVEAVQKRWGGVHVLVNNGGISQRSLAKDTDLSISRRIFDTNFFGTIELTRQALPLMKSGSRIVVISSVVGKVATPMRSSYAASKHALQGYFDSLRAELHEEGIGVTVILPGYVRTNVSLNALTATGGAQGTMDSSTAAGMEPAELARRILRSIEKGERESVIAGSKESLGILLSRFAPGLLARVVRKAQVT